MSGKEGMKKHPLGMREAIITEYKNGVGMLLKI